MIELTFLNFFIPQMIPLVKAQNRISGKYSQHPFPTSNHTGPEEKNYLDGRGLECLKL
jgi:hypothetical protein